MTMLTTTEDVGGLLPAEYGKLITQPVDEQSAIIRASTLVTTSASEYHTPQVTEDSQASWVAEGAEIPQDDPVLAELVTVPRKIAGLTVVSSELANDSSPDALRIMGQSLARDIARKIDVAAFGDLAAPAPPGLEGLTGITTIQLGAGVVAWVNLDPFAAAVNAAEQEGATISSFVANPDDALSLAVLKDEDGSNRPLLGSDPANAGARTVLGVPLITSPAVTAGTIWGIPRVYSLVIRRTDVQVTRSDHAFFSSDKIAVRAIMRVAFAWPHPAAVVAVRLAAA
ncbi:phage major capsid protein [Pseudonocardia sp. MH-G8]|uniref:phage major capsid protein n=1 Tax=Pseudonocardia sp. MH-G8 TaxID=1854588 RepID=UPI000BA0D872|nr:phage major capsid protein [Pseudonocardia sp. MH-G8]OZM81147.1 phage major capsid protein [Pseudonocardia sp. MH-G8]